MQLSIREPAKFQSMAHGGVWAGATGRHVTSHCERPRELTTTRDRVTGRLYPTALARPELVSVGV